MRLFAGDHFPRLAVQHGDLLRPWVMPSWAPRGHRDRLAALLAQALRALDPGLTLVELRWAERHYLLSGRLQLPSAALVRWQVDAVPVVEPANVVLDGSRLTPGLPLFDFAGETTLPGEAWLGPLKMQVLHRIQDRLFDERPVAMYEELADTIGDLAAMLVSPIDLVTAAEALIDAAAQGEKLETAVAAALGRVIADRFVDKAPDMAIRALVAAGRGERDESATALLVKAGLADDAGPLPLLGRVRDEGVLRRAALQLAQLRGVEGSLADLAPGIFPEPNARPNLAEVGVASALSPVNATAAPPPDEPESPILRQAIDQINRGDASGAAQAILRAYRDPQHPWAQPDLKLAGTILHMLGGIGDIQRGPSMARGPLESIAVLYETAAELLQRADEPAAAVDALSRAAFTYNFLYDWTKAESLYERASSLAAAINNKALLATAFQNLAEMKWRLGRAQEALADAEKSVALFRELQSEEGEVGALRTAGDVRVVLGLLEGAQEAYERALILLRARATAPSSIAPILISLGKVHHRRGNLKAARQAFEEGVAACHAGGQRLIEASAHHALGDLSLSRGEILRAREAFEEAAAIHHELKNGRGEMEALDRLGDVRVTMNEAALAREAYDAGITLARDMANRGAEATLLYKRASTLAQTDRAAALHDGEEALRINEALGNVQAQVLALKLLYTIESGRKNWSDAIRWQTRLCALLRQTDSPPELTQALTDLALASLFGGQLAMAAQAAEEAAEMARRTGDERASRLAALVLNTIEAEGLSA